MRILRWLEAVAVAAVCAYGAYTVSESKLSDRLIRERAARAAEETKERMDRGTIALAQLAAEAAKRKPEPIDPGIEDSSNTTHLLHQIYLRDNEIRRLKAELEMDRKPK